MIDDDASNPQGLLDPRPMFLQRLSSDEYEPLPYTKSDWQVLARTHDVVRDASFRTGAAPGRIAQSRVGTALGLRALNDEAGAIFYDVPVEATLNESIATEHFSGRLPVIDIQTHFMAQHCYVATESDWNAWDKVLRTIMPDFWTGLEHVVRRDLAEYLVNVFLETETACAVLTSGAGLDMTRHVFNDEMAATRSLIDGMAGTGRVLSHAVIHADRPEELEAMERWRDELQPIGWKVYTAGNQSSLATVGGANEVRAWMLDDEDYGFPFLERARELGVHLVCAHKGLSQMVDNGSPRDIGPAAKAFPDLTFVVYHSGYEFPLDGAPLEGTFEESSAHFGVNRLIESVRGAGIGRGGNVYAELGTTWFSLIRRPEEAAHVLGKLIANLGPDNVMWGTDSIWYGSSQPLIDAFRAFQIPEDMCNRFGYEPLTLEVKEKILSRNAARVYGIDLDDLAGKVADDDLSWARRLADEYRSYYRSRAQ